MTRGGRRWLACAIVLSMVSVVFSSVPMVVSPTDSVMLHPGHLHGTLTIDGGAVDNGRVVVLDEDYQQAGHDPHATDGEYAVDLEGCNDYYVLPIAQINEYDTGYHAQSNISLPMEEVHIAGEYVDDKWVPDDVELDFDMVPAYIDATVTVSEGNIDLIYWGAHCRPNAIGTAVYATTKREMTFDEDGTHPYLDGKTVFPVIPWGIDSTAPYGVVDNQDSHYLHVSASVRVDGVIFQLPYKYIGTKAGETVTLSWHLDLTKGSTSGYVDIEGDDPYTYRVNGAATIEGSNVALYGDYLDPRYPWDIPTSYQEYWEYDPDDTFSKELFSGDWELFPEVHFYDPDNDLDSYLSFRGDPTSETIEDDVNSVVNWDIDPCFVEGTVSTYGVDPPLDWIIVRADLPQTHWRYDDAWTLSHTNDYRLILYEESWYVGAPSVSIYFDHDLSYKQRGYGTSALHVADFGIQGVDDPTTLTAGETVEGPDFTYGIAMITLEYLVEGGGQVGLESMTGYQHNAAGSSGINYDFSAQGIPGMVDVGDCTMVMPAGLNHITASAYVESGAQAVFGEFWIDVDAGDVIVSDVGAPVIDVTAPTGMQEVDGASVTVTGTATDDVGVETIMVNGVDVAFTSTSNPEDPNEVSFTTTVSGLSYGENTITVVANDAEDRSSSVERTVISDNEVPVIDSFAVSPIEPVKLGDLTTVTAEVSDPNQDELTTTIYWGDGTSTTSTDGSIETTHEYEAAGVYTVTLSVTDGVYTAVAVHRYVVVYDPDGGFVTGGGWIVSPEGAYAADESLTGKANFGFVSKYKKGADVPTGNVEFQFKVGDLNFHSGDFDWLVVAGSKAKFKGTGTINGEGNYGFMISAIDGGDDGADTFRIKIWDKDADDAVVYDNQLGDEDDEDPTTELGGGQMVVHKG